MKDSTKKRVESRPPSRNARNRELIGHRVTGRIRELIISGALPPGERIGQEDLANRFKTSRIPVREALRRLESEGLVVLIANSGAWVAKLDLQECIELYKIRERLEALALAEAVPKISKDEVAILEKLAGEMEETQDNDSFLRLDREFHLASYRASGMIQLIGMVERFWNTTQHYRRAFIKISGPARRGPTNYEHRLIVDAIQRGDAEGAGRILREHIRRTRFELERNREIFQLLGSAYDPSKR
ncbi:MAG TPA: GntR family transcriptional regulator [Steroidobacteraceae bacterium]